MPKFDFSRLTSSLTSAAASEFSKSVNSQKLSGEAAHLLTGAGEKMSQAFVRELASASASYMTSKLSNNSALGDLAGKLVESLVKEISQQAQNQLRTAGGTVRQQAANYLQTPVGSAQPAPLPGPAIPSSQAYMDQAVARMHANEQYRNFVRRMPGAYLPESLANQPGYRIENDVRYARRFDYTPPLPPLPNTAVDQEARGRVPYSRQVSSFFSKGGEGGGGAASAVSFFAIDYGVKSLISGVTSSLQTVNQLIQQSGQLQKNIGATGTPAQQFYRKVGGAAMGLGYLPQDMLAAASVYMPSALSSSPYDITQLTRFSNSYGVDPTQWAAQMAQAAGQLGYTGGAQGSVGLSAYQGLLATAYASSSGLAKMGDFTTGWQDLARLMQANTTTPPSLSGPNSALQLYTKLNQSKIAGLSGTSAGALLGQLNQSLVNGPTSGSPGVQMAFYQAIGGRRGVSPAELQYITEEGIGGKDLQGHSVLSDLINYGNKMYAGFSPMDKTYAMSKILGLNEHQTQAFLGAYTKNGGFSGQALTNLIHGAGLKNLNQVNAAQMPLLAQLAGNKSLTSVAQEALQENVSGVKALMKHGHFTGSRQKLADLIISGGTPESEADKQRQAANALAQQMQIAASKVQDFWRALQNSLAGIMQAVNKFILPPLDKMGEAHPIATAILGGAATGVGVKEAVKLPGKAWRKFTGTKSTSERLTESESRLARLEGKFSGERQGTGRSYGRRIGLEPPDSFLDDPYAGTGAGAEGAAGIDPLAWPFIVAQQAYDPHSGLNHLMKDFGIWSGGTGGVPPAYRVMPGWSTALGTMHRVPGGRAIGGGTGLTPALLQKEEQAAQSYRATLGDTYYQHLKASNKTSEGVVGRALNTSTPLDTTTLRTLTTQLAKFINAFGKQVTDWTQSSFNAALSTANPGNTGSGSSGGPGSGAGGTLKNFVYTAGGKGVASPLRGKFSINQGFGGHLSAEPSGYLYPDGSIGYVYKPGATYYSHLHNGIDLGTPMGTPIYAGYAGKISEGWDKTGFGNKVTLDNGRYTELFGHLSRYAVKNGTMVKQGQLIGYTGSSGNSTGPHLHFSVEDDKTGDFIDPTAFYKGTTGTGVSAAMAAGSGSGGGSGSSKLWNALLSKVPAQYKKLYQRVGAMEHVPWQFLAMQGFKESGWNPTSVSPDGGYGIAQFTGATGYKYLGGANWRQVAMDPAMSIAAQGVYMHDLLYGGDGLKGEGGNLWAAARDYNGSGPKAVQYANSLMGMLGVSGQSYMLSNGVGGGGAGVQPQLRVTIDPLTIDVRHPDGSKETIRVQPRVKFAGITGVHTEPMPTQHGVAAHPASKALIKR